MVIQIKLYKLNEEPEIKTYRDVKPFDYGAYVAGFYANRPYYIGGEMFKIKGKDIKLVHFFGKVSPEHAKLRAINYEPTTKGVIAR